MGEQGPSMEEQSMGYGSSSDEDDLEGFGAVAGGSDDNMDLQGFGQMEGPDTDSMTNELEGFGDDSEMPVEGPSMTEATAFMDGPDMGMGNGVATEMDMGESVFEEGGRSENATMGNLLEESDMPLRRSEDMFALANMDRPENTPIMERPPPPSQLTDAINDYRTAEAGQRESGRMNAGMDKSMEYRGMPQEPAYRPRGGRGRVRY